jgi:uncharacterized protein
MNSVLRTLLSEWRERQLPEVIGRDKKLDLKRREVRSATVVTGFRRVGKTYMVYEAINKLLKAYSREEVVYINFEDERILSPGTEMLTGLIPGIQDTYGGKPKYLFLDELQLIPNWSKWVRRVLDTESVELVVTGSSAKMGSAELPTELRGRAWEVKVEPLSFDEFLRFKPGGFDEYLVWGGLPAVVLTEMEKKQELLQSYFQTVVHRDIAERYSIGNNVALRILLKLLLNSSYITISKLHNSLKSLGVAVGKSTIDNYLAYIKTAYFLDELYIYHQAVKNQLLYPRKVYFVDTGLMTALSTKFSKNMGRLLENWLFHKLADKGEAMYYYKDDRGNEVDFVVMAEGKARALYQVCWDVTDEDTRQREVIGLVKAGVALKCDDLNLVIREAGGKKMLPGGIKVVPALEL